ncbi:hypothetical protein [Spirosoma koreense]
MKTNNAIGKIRIVNWVTVWGFIFGCIAFNLYFDTRQTRMTRNWYRARYEAESQRADSLQRAAVQLKQRLQQVQSATASNVSINPISPAQRAMPARPL